MTWLIFCAVKFQVFCWTNPEHFILMILKSDVLEEEKSEEAELD
jgi:hypothetical protein